jgi:hypothetical protein
MRKAASIGDIPRRLRVRWFALCLAGATFVVCSTARADDTKALKATASGEIVSIAICSPTEVCQQTVVFGKVSHIGSIAGVLEERVDRLNGSYSGTATFTRPNGDAIHTTYTGQVTPPDADGTVTFFEHHVVTGGTGRFLGIRGELDGVGTATATGHIEFDATGRLVRP